MGMRIFVNRASRGPSQCPQRGFEMRAVIVEIMEQVRADPYTPDFKKPYLLRRLQWVMGHTAEFKFVRLTQADVMTGTHRIITAPVAVFMYKGEEVFTHTFITTDGQMVLSTIGKIKFTGEPIAPIPFSFVGFYQVAFRKLEGNTLMDSINLGKGEIE